MSATAIFSDRLLSWFDAHGRKQLPWQRDPTPYRVWVSEIMLQQTQVGTVIGYYERFIARFPDVHTLATAPLDEVLHLWAGLGYYARARNLQACAKVLASTYGGDFPRTLKDVTALPGIGRSTAAAVLALSRGEPHAILDGNVKRVLARVFAIEGDPSKPATLARLWAQAQRCMPSRRIVDYTQGIMDLGATLCTRARPQCSRCPLQGICVAVREQRQSELPHRKTKRSRGSREATLLLAEVDGDEGLAIMLERRPESGIWGGLWSPPQFDSEKSALDWCRREMGEPAREPENLQPIDHAFTHFDLRLSPLRVRCRTMARVHQDRERLWYTLRSAPRIGLPQPIRVLIDRMLIE